VRRRHLLSACSTALLAGCVGSRPGGGCEDLPAFERSPSGDDLLSVSVVDVTDGTPDGVSFEVDLDAGAITDRETAAVGVAVRNLGRDSLTVSSGLPHPFDAVASNSIREEGAVGWALYDLSNGGPPPERAEADCWRPSDPLSYGPSQSITFSTLDGCESFTDRFALWAHHEADCMPTGTFDFEASLAVGPDRSSLSEATVGFTLEFTA